MYTVVLSVCTEHLFLMRTVRIVKNNYLHHCMTYHVTAYLHFLFPSGLGLTAMMGLKLLKYKTI